MIFAKLAQLFQVSKYVHPLPSVKADCKMYENYPEKYSLTAPKTCKPEQFTCSNGQCILKAGSVMAARTALMAPTNKTAVSLFHKNFYMECSVFQNVLTEISWGPRLRCLCHNRDVAFCSLSYRKRGMDSLGNKSFFFLTDYNSLKTKGWFIHLPDATFFTQNSW